MTKLLLPAILLFVTTLLQADERVYELRTYTATPGHHADILARFRDHTTKLFEKHGMQNIGYWTPADGPGKSNLLIYIISHKNAEAAKASWDAFRKDPEWIKVRDASEVNGKIVEKIESIYLTPTDFSKLK